MNQKSLWKIIGAVAIINLASRFFGFFREVIIGYHFGTSSSADSIINAYTIPNFIYIVAGGAVTTAFISVYNKTNDLSAQRKVRDVIFTYTFLLFAMISVFFVMFPTNIIQVVFHGLTYEEMHLTAGLFQVMGISTFFLVLSMFFSGALNVQGKFHLTSLAPLVNNLLFIIVAVSLFPLLKEQSYAWGAVLGSIIMALILFISIRKGERRPFQFRFSMADTGYMFRFIKVFFPILLGGATLQFYFLVHRIYASTLEAGYVASLNYSSKLVQLPQAILMTAVTTVIYPLITKKVGEGDKRGLRNIYRDGIQYLLLLMIPSTVFIFFYSENIVKVIFEYGSFTAESTQITSNLLKILVLAMFAHAANLYVTRFFYAMEKAVLPVISGIVAVFGINVLFIHLFIQPYGAKAIAWGTTAGAYFQLIILLIGCRYMLKLSSGNLLRYGKFGLLTILLIIVSFLFKKWFYIAGNNILNLCVGLLFIGISFIIISLLLKISEIKKLFSFLPLGNRNKNL